MSDWGLHLDTVQALKRLHHIDAGFSDRTRLHERIVIVLQQRTFRNWGKGWDPLSDFTMLSRRGSTPLSDSGHMKLSLVGVDPGKIGTADDTLNAAGSSVSLFGTRAIQARLMNEGGLVDPVRAKYLALPMTREARKVRSPRDFPRDLALWPFKDRSGFFLVDAERVTITRGPNKGNTRVRPVKVDGGYPEAHYMLTKQVEIPARRFFPTQEEATVDAMKVGNHWMKELASGRQSQQQSDF